VVRVIVLDNDRTLLGLMDEVLSMQGWECLALPGDTCFTVIEQAAADLIILDVWLGTPERGLSLLHRLQATPGTQSIPIIVCSGALDRLRPCRPWLDQHRIPVLPKPFELDELFTLVRSALAGDEHS
jgi:DNA-binding response OmpR family regulator